MAEKIPLKLNLGPNEIQEFVTGDTVPEAHLPNTLVKLTGAQTLVDKTLDPTTVASRLLAVGATPARVLDLASTGGSTATNYDAVKLTTQAAGNGAIVSPVTSGTEANLKLQGFGATGNVLVRNSNTDMGVVVGTTGTQTLSGKTLITPTIVSFSNATHNHTDLAGGGTLSAGALPADTLYANNPSTVANKTFQSSCKIQSTLLEGSGTVPALSVGLTGSPTSLDYSCPKVVANVSAGGAVLSVESTATHSNLILQGKGTGLVTTSNGEVVGTSGVQTLTNKTLTTPTLSVPSIADFSSAQHDHSSPAEGGGIDAAAIATGSFSQDRIADLANRQGSLGYGISSRVLKSDATAAGSGGTAAWAERARVVQVDCPAPADTAGYKLTSATVPVLPVNSLLQPFANFTIPTTTTSNFAFNTLPDCAKVKNPSGTPTGASNGKVIRFTLIGGARCNAVARNLNIQFYLDSATGPTLLMTNIQSASTLTIGTVYEFVVKGTLVFFGDGATNSGYYGALELAQLRDFGGTAIAMGNYLATGFFAPSTINTTNADAFKKIRVEMGFSNATAAAVNEYITLHAAIWEVLN